MEERTIHEIEKAPGFAGYAGIVERLLAFLVDAILTGVALMALEYGLTVGIGSEGAFRNVYAMITYDILFPCFYCAAMESSPLQATVGKLLVGIKVTDYNGERISFKKGIIRFIGKFFSVLPWGIGFFVIIADRQKRSFHDRLAGTLVLRKRKSGFKGWIEETENEERTIETGGKA